MKKRLVTCLAVLLILLIFGVYAKAEPVYNPVYRHYYDIIDVPGGLTCSDADAIFVSSIPVLHWYNLLAFRIYEQKSAEDNQNRFGQKEFI